MNINNISCIPIQVDKLNPVSIQFQNTSSVSYSNNTTNNISNVVTNSVTQVSNLTIEGIPVEFPRVPYPCQIDYMRGVIDALNKSNNALLESPTGTGKTLCLLCATLAWQQYMKSKGGNLSYSSEPTTSTTSMHPNMPKTAAYTIVYATRTHSQLAQVVRELRSTTYTPRMTVLGSRDQLCIHEKISKLNRTVMTHACNSLNSKRGCMYKNNLENYMNSSASLDNTSSLDIEDMVKLGKQRSICPYFHSREFSASSEIVFVPYNYLLDTSIRKTLKLNWDKCIIIFDEAHNLERVAADAASFTFRSTDLALCIQEMQRVLVILRETEEMGQGTTIKSEQATATSALDGGSNSSSVGVVGVVKPRLSVVVQVIKAMFALESSLDRLDMSSQSKVMKSISGLVHPGEWLAQLLRDLGFRMEYVDEMKKCSNILLEEAQDAKDGGLGTSTGPLPIVEPKLVLFTQAIERVIRSDSGNYTSEYKVYINEEASIKPPAFSANQLLHQHQQFYPKPVKNSKVVNYWCFSTGVAMNELKKIGVKSILLTSGTLSPMLALREDIKLPFAVELENPHVISNKQMWVGAIPVGHAGIKLNSSYASRDSNSYKSELGESVIQICQTMLGNFDPPSVTAMPVSNSISSMNNNAWNAYGLNNNPVVYSKTASSHIVNTSYCVKGGVLIFFPSYSVLDSTVQYWKECGVYARLKNLVGHILSESKSNSNSYKGAATTTGANAKSYVNYKQVDKSFMNMNTNKAVDRSYSKTLSSDLSNDSTTSGHDDQDEQEFNNIVTEFNHAIETHGGCVLMAVCRGKVSEGIDFSDNKGRVVIITGIPFAPLMDPWVVLKKQFLDEKRSGKITSTNQNASAPINISRVNAVISSYNNDKIANNINSIIKQEQSNSVGNIWQNAARAVSTETSMQATTNNNTAHIYPPPPNSNSNNSATIIKNIPNMNVLDGQEWYSQSAGRAINQCIGRVIRHHKDWGSVFLLDERFSNDKQLSQLSGWLRPRVVKFKTFNDAMQGFRSFLIDITQNVEVNNYLAQKHQQLNKPIRILNLTDTTNHHIKKPENVFERQVVIKNEILNSAEEDTFINPSFLLTQPQQLQYPIANTKPPFKSNDAHKYNNNTVREKQEQQQNTMKYENDVIDLFLTRRNTLPISSTITITAAATTTSSTINHNSISNDNCSTSNTTKPLLGIVERMKNNSHIQRINNILDNNSNSSNSSNSISNPNTIHSFFKMHQQKASNNNSSSSPENVNPNHSGSIESSDGSTIDKQSDGVISNSSMNNRNRISFSQLSQKQNQDKHLNTLDYTQTKQQQHHHHHNTTKEDHIRYLAKLDFNEQIAILKTWYSKIEMGKLQDLLKCMKFIQNNTVLKQIVADLWSFLNKVEDETVKLDTLLCFHRLLSKQYREDYIELVYDHRNKNNSNSYSDQPTNSINTKKRKENNNNNNNRENKTTAVASSTTTKQQQHPFTLAHRVDDVDSNIHDHLQSILKESKLVSQADLESQLTQSDYTTGGGVAIGAGDQKESTRRFIPSKRARSILNASILKSAQHSSNPNLIAAATTTKIPSNLERQLSINLSTKTSSTSSSGTTASSSISNLDLDKLTELDHNNSSKSSQSLSSSTAMLPPFQSSKLNKLTCLICREKSNLPCANRCGHICCQSCWIQWLAINNSCPMCRKPASTQSVTRIIIK